MGEALAPLLSVRGLSKSFGGVKALASVDFDVLPGEVHGLLGENGSGKSTVMKILAGFHDPDAGRLEIRGRDVPLPLTPGQFQSLRIAFVHQDLALIPAMSVYENLMLGDLAWRSGLRRVKWRDERRAAEAVLSRYGVYVDVTASIQHLRPVEQALVAIVRALDPISTHPDEHGKAYGVLCLDEPTAFLPRHEVDQLFDLVQRIAKMGAGVIFVSHDLDEVRRITDRVTILRNGANVGTFVTRETSLAKLTQLIVGRDIEAMPTTKSPSRSGPSVISVRGLRTESLEDVSFDISAGEVLGVTGLVGSGFEDVPYALMGACAVHDGVAVLFGKTMALHRLSPAEAISKGIALVPGDRQREGSIATLPMSANMMQLVIGRYFRRGILNSNRMRQDTRTLMDTYDIRPRDPDMAYGSFSGGNQQKGLLAKWLQSRPRLLLLDEPTHGVDVGARRSILGLVREAAASGTPVVYATSDYEPLAMVADRVLIFAYGQVKSELVGTQITKESITSQCLLGSGPATPSLPHKEALA